MPQSLHTNFAHIVFSTKERMPVISGDIAPRIHAYLAGIIRDLGGSAIAIGGMPDHLHILAKTSKLKTDADFMKHVKGSSSAWINENSLIAGRFAWQAGYGWFSVSPRDTGQVSEYIQRQAEHHKKVTFQDEYRKFLTQYGIEFDEQYLWD